MGARGVHFALTADRDAQFLALPSSDPDAMLALAVAIENNWDEEWLAQTDKAWEAIHRCLTDGRFEWGTTTAHQVILGSKNIYAGEGFLMNFITSADVKAAAALMQGIDQTALRSAYDRIDPAEYLDKSETDFEYTWMWFEVLKAFFRKAAVAGRAVLFTVDQ